MTKLLRHDSRFTIHDSRRVLITAGPTREYIDPVRYISNDSSGKMGFALARAAVKKGFESTIICGPVTIPTPKGAKRVDVVSAVQMRKEVLKRLSKSDVIIMAAAVADWRPAHFSKHKIKKQAFTLHSPAVSLKPTPDILKEVCKKKRPHQIAVGFALETGNLKKNALQKLKQKNCDWIIANNAASIGADKSSVLMIHKDSHKTTLKNFTKDRLAEAILKKITG